MKKISLYILLIIFSFFIMSCKDGEKTKTINNDDFVPVSISQVVLDKDTFYSDEEIVLSGKIFVIYSDNSELRFSLKDEAVSYDVSDLKIGNNLILITYNFDGTNLSYEVDLEIIERSSDVDKVVTMTNPKLKKQVFTSNEEIILEGTCVLTKESGTVEVFNFTNADVTLPSEIKVGDNLAIITYKGSDVTLTITITFTVIEVSSSDDNLAIEVETFLRNKYEGFEITHSLDLVFEYKDVSIDYESLNTKILSHGGKYYQPILDTTVDIQYYFLIGNDEYTGIITLIAKGYGDYIDATFAILDNLVPSKVYEDFTMITSYEEYYASIIWSVDGVVCEDGLVSIPKLGDDYTIELNCRVTADNKTRDKNYTIYCSMLTDVQRINKVMNQFTDLFKDLVIDDDYPLPTKEDHYGCRLTWYSYNPDMLTNEGKYTEPLFDININFMLTVTYGQDSDRKIITIKLKGHQYDDTWDKVEYFLNRIHQEEIKTQKYTLYGSEEGYYYVTAYNEGYLPFYTTDELSLIVDYLPNGTNLKPDVLRSYTYFITLHNTGMAAPSATAKGLNDYIHSTDRQASWHFAVDDKEAYNHVPVDEASWHAGDGGRSVNQIWYSSDYRFYGIGGGNYYSVGIEMCVNSGGDFNWTMRNTAKLVSSLLVKYHLDPSRIRQHYDYSGKDCPQVLRHANRWGEMLELISLEYFARTQLNGVEFEWTSLNPDIMDNTGTVINNPKVDTEIGYKVKVTFNGEAREYTYTSLLQKSKK